MTGDRPEDLAAKLDRIATIMRGFGLRDLADVPPRAGAIIGRLRARVVDLERENGELRWLLKCASDVVERHARRAQE